MPTQGISLSAVPSWSASFLLSFRAWVLAAANSCSSLRRILFGSASSLLSRVCRNWYSRWSSRCSFSRHEYSVSWYRWSGSWNQSTNISNSWRTKAKENYCLLACESCRNQRFGEHCCLHLKSKDGESRFLRNAGNFLHHYTMSPNTLAYGKAPDSYLGSVRFKSQRAILNEAFAVFPSFSR